MRRPGYTPFKKEPYKLRVDLHGYDHYYALFVVDLPLMKQYPHAILYYAFICYIYLL
jgi:hypothetical protein